MGVMAGTQERPINAKCDSAANQGSGLARGWLRLARVEQRLEALWPLNRYPGSCLGRSSGFLLCPSLEPTGRVLYPCTPCQDVFVKKHDIKLGFMSPFVAAACKVCSRLPLAPEPHASPDLHMIRSCAQLDLSNPLRPIHTVRTKSAVPLPVARPMLWQRPAHPIPLRTHTVTGSTRFSPLLAVIHPASHYMPYPYPRPPPPSGYSWCIYRRSGSNRP